MTIKWAGDYKMAARSGEKPEKINHAYDKQAGRVSSTDVRRKSYIISRDVQSLRQKKRVSQLLQTESFVAELEGILQTQLGGQERPKLTRPDANIGKVPPPPPLPSMAGTAGSQVQVGGHTLGVLPINDLRGALSSKYPLAERQLRCKLAATYRLVDMFGMSAGIYNHITVRVPGSAGKDHFLLNPFGLLYHEVTASNVVKVDMDGTVVDPGTTQLGVNSAGYALHSAIHEARPDVNCIIHVHTVPGAAVSAMTCGLLPICQEALGVGPVSYHPYCGIVAEEEKEQIKQNVKGQNKVLILQNHGLAALGSTVEEAFDILIKAVEACKVQVAAMHAGVGGLVQLGPEVMQRVAAVMQQGGGGVSVHRLWGPGELEFEAYMRMLDSKGYNTGYKYKGQHLLRPPSGQQQPRTQVHLTSEERAEMEQFQQERQARNAERKKRRRQQQDRRSKEAEPRKQGGTGLEDDAQDPWEFLPTASKVTPELKPSPQEDPWATVTIRILNKAPENSGNTVKSCTMHKGRHRGIRGEMGPTSALERAKLTAKRVAQSTDHAVKAVAGNAVLPSSPSPGNAEETQPEVSKDSSLVRARETAKAVADSTAQAAKKLTGDNTAVVINGLNRAGLEDIEGSKAEGREETAEELDDPFVSLQVNRRPHRGRKVQSWMDSMPREEEGGRGTQSLEKVATTAEQVAEFTTSAVEKLSEALNGL